MQTDEEELVQTVINMRQKINSRKASGVSETEIQKKPQIKQMGTSTK